MEINAKTNMPAENAAKTEPKDIFLHLLEIIALYTSVTAFLVMIFQYINILIPDSLTDGYYQLQDYFSGIRWSISSLIIIFPVYIWTGYYLNKIYALEPEKRDLKIRKWLLNLTIFAAALIIIGDLVALIYNFLGGDLTSKFVLKVAAILFVAASVFFYYFWELKAWSKISAAARKIFIYAIIGIVAATVIAGFFVVGSPNRARLMKFDEQRVANLQTIQGQIIYYWQNKNKLPQNLADLKDTVSGFAAPKDPRTGADYNYQVKGELEFSLCADFDLSILGSASSVELPTYPARYISENSNWNHAAGNVCFNRIIDKDLYSPKILR